MSYWDACMAYADDQGLTDALTQLEKIFGSDCGLYQSGGFCMVIQIEAPIGHVWVTYDGDWVDGRPDPDSPDGWVVGYYADPEDDSTFEYTYTNFANIPEAVEHYRRSCTP